MKKIITITFLALALTACKSTSDPAPKPTKTLVSMSCNAYGNRVLYWSDGSATVKIYNPSDSCARTGAP